MPHACPHWEMNGTQYTYTYQRVSKSDAESGFEVFVFLRFIKVVAKWNSNGYHEETGHVYDLPEHK